MLLLDLIIKDLIVEAHLLLVSIVIIYLFSSLLIDLVALHLDALDSVTIAFIVSSSRLIGARRVGPISLSLRSANFRSLLVSTKYIILVVFVSDFRFSFALWSSFLTFLLNTYLPIQIESFAVDQSLVFLNLLIGAVRDGPGLGVLVFSVLEDWLGHVLERVGALP